MQFPRVKPNRALLILLLFVPLFGCDDGTVDDDSVTLTFTFEESSEGWTGGFVDYATHMTSEDLELEFDRRALPDEVDDGRFGLFLAGRNLSDDLFMYVKRELTGFRPNTAYRLAFRLSIASSAPSGCVGIGGAPGEAVRVKVGAAEIEPDSVVVDDHVRLNIAKDADPDDPGELRHVREVGDVANGIEECTEDVPYRLITRSNLDDPVEATTDASGSLWVFVGTDSGFEGKTTLYYDSIEVMVER